MKYLVTGGCGFLGANLASEILKQGGELAVLDNLHRRGSASNLAWLESQGGFRFFHADVRSPGDVAQVFREFRPDAVFHVAGQVAMTTSLAQPRLDFEVNALGTLNVLEAARAHAPQSSILYSSTNKVYGDLEQLRYEEQATRYVCPDYPDGLDESLPLDFRSPYGCSKGAADQYVLDYARAFGLNTVVFRHSSMYGGRQFATYDQGWVGWFCQQALRVRGNPQREPFTISGNGKQVRDVLHASDAAACYLSAVKHMGKVRGRAFNLGGGLANSLSLLELFELLQRLLDVPLTFRRLPPRASDQKFFVANNAQVKAALGWEPRVSARDGVGGMLEWLESQPPANDLS